MPPCLVNRIANEKKKKKKAAKSKPAAGVKEKRHVLRAFQTFGYPRLIGGLGVSPTGTTKLSLNFATPRTPKRL